MEFETIGVIVVCFVTIVAFLKPILELNKLFVKMQVTLNNLESLMKDDKICNKEEHKRFFDFMNKTNERINKIEAWLENYKDEH